MTENIQFVLLMVCIGIMCYLLYKLKHKTKGYPTRLYVSTDTGMFEMYPNTEKIQLDTVYRFDFLDSNWFSETNNYFLYVGKDKEVYISSGKKFQEALEITMRKMEERQNGN